MKCHITDRSRRLTLALLLIFLAGNELYNRWSLGWNTLNAGGTVKELHAFGCVDLIRCDAYFVDKGVPGTPSNDVYDFVDYLLDQFYLSFDRNTFVLCSCIVLALLLLLIPTKATTGAAARPK